jgi:BlaI family penicillinase repressor
MSSPRISDAEWEVMEILWESSPRTAQEVVAALAAHQDWKDQTIRTMLARLVKKEALTFRAEGKTYFYKPAVSRDQCVRGESRSFLRRVFRGATAPLLVELVKESRLKPEEIAELKRILNEKEKRP